MRTKTAILTDLDCRKAKPGDKDRRLYDGRGLFLLIQPNGRKGWRWKYTFGGRANMLSFGSYPEVSLIEARRKLDAGREQLRNGINPTMARKSQKAARAAEANTFEAVAREWFEKNRAKWVPTYAVEKLARLDHDVFPYLGPRPIGSIEPPEVLAMLRRIEARGAIVMAHRASQLCSAVFRYAVATGRATRDATQDLRGALSAPAVKHMASITEPRAVGELLRACRGYQGSFVVQCALRLAPLVFVRPGELRHAEWSEINLDAAEWRLPAAKMKMRAPHLVPLSTQAVAVLRELYPVTGDGRYVFPSGRGGARPMSNNGVLAALRRMGYANGEMTGHGFRSLASTLLNELGWNRDAIERQLAHAERDEVRAAYNYAEHLPERRKMMQAWADYLDTLAAGVK